VSPAERPGHLLRGVRKPVNSALRESTHCIFGLHASPFQSLLPFALLPLRFSRQVFILCVSQRLRQLGVSAVVGQ
jgi:hypothetical protein